MGRTFAPARSHQTYGPSRRRGGGGGNSSPSRIGLIQWLKGDVELVSTAGVGDTWGDQSGLNQDVAAQPPINPGPFTGLDTLDTIPGITFDTDGGHGATPLRGFFRVGGLVDRNGAPMGYGPGETQSRTEINIIKPRFSPTVFGITGGILSEWGSTPAWQPLFDLEPNFGNPQGFYLFAPGTWRGAANAGPDTVGGAGGTYDGVPLCMMLTSPVFPTIACRINNAAAALVPLTMGGATGPTISTLYSIGRQTSGGFNFFGAIFERLIYDYDITTVPAELTKTINYLRNRYPSIAFV
jgi:hypothetical protein